jgi:hypothetical protein
LRITSVQIQSTVTPSVREDRAAALEIAQRAAEISHANVVGETADEVDPSSVDASLLADGYATLALGYRYIVGLYPTDSQMSKLGELAVRLVLLAEREYDPVVSAGDSLRRSLTTGARLVENLHLVFPTLCLRQHAIATTLSVRLIQFPDDLWTKFYLWRDSLRAYRLGD